MYLLQLFLVCLATGVSLGRPDGAPQKSCMSMHPGHVGFIPISPQNVADSPYQIEAKWDDQRQYVHVSVTGSTLAGFLIQARRNEDSPAVGHFKALAGDSKYQDCTGKEFEFNQEASITHRNSSLKSNLAFLWEPSPGQNENITFYATIAKSKEKFWVKLPSNKIDTSEKFTPTPRPSPSSSVTDNEILRNIKPTNETLVEDNETGSNIRPTNKTSVQPSNIAHSVSTSVTSVVVLLVLLSIQLFIHC